MAKAPKNHRAPWTRDQDRGLRRLAGGNTPTRLIARELGRTEEAVYSRAHEIGVSLKPVNQSPYGPRRR